MGFASLCTLRFWVKNKGPFAHEDGRGPRYHLTSPRFAATAHSVPQRACRADWGYAVTGVPGPVYSPLCGFLRPASFWRPSAGQHCGGFQPMTASFLSAWSLLTPPEGALLAICICADYTRRPAKSQLFVFYHRKMLPKQDGSSKRKCCWRNL